MSPTPAWVIRELEREITELREQVAILKENNRQDYIRTQSRLVQALAYIKFLENKLGIGREDEE